ncbi:AcrVA2 family anti-CRISPR protein [Azohydromonas aeria]|uniref:AcrVA2 family anti-CRISPR protein n=1 Tax=Azohydromonas aeria TaxID=2590212 RepID=UPI0012FADE72|nr:hypothetical protein [Azohydromonas aeria]
MPGLRFADLAIKRDPVSLDISFNVAPLQAFAQGNGLDLAQVDAGDVMERWYRLHREAGGAPDAVCEAIGLEVRSDIGRPAIAAAMQARAALKGVEMAHPDLWRRLDVVRARRGEIPKTTREAIWPAWCFIPSHLVLHEIEAELRARGISAADAVNQATMLTLLGAWRPSQGVYRFDPDVYRALIDTEVRGDIPHNVLTRLPEWCVFIETPGMDVGQGAPDPLTGAFVGLDPGHAPGQPDTHPHLLITFLARDTLDSVAIALGPWSLPECVERAVRQLDPGYTLPPEALARVMRQVMPILSLTLYLCTDAPDLGGEMPQRPEPVKTKRGPRLFPPQKPREWDVAVRIGGAIRAAHAARREPEITIDGSRAPMRPHVRAAHWHGVWTGPRTGPRRFKLNWLPPIPVNIEDPAKLPTVIRRVAGEA